MKEFVILSKQDAEREKRNARYNPAIDCGAKGRIFENRNARPKSNKKERFFMLFGSKWTRFGGLLLIMRLLYSSLNAEKRLSEY